MRNVALASVLLLLLAAHPLPGSAAPADNQRMSAVDECRNGADTRSLAQTCIRFDYPAPPPPQQGIPQKAGQRAFLHLGVLACPPQPSCVLNHGSQSTSTLTGTAARTAVLYVDTNGLAGLQRTGVFLEQKWYPADGVALV